MAKLFNFFIFLSFLSVPVLALTSLEEFLICENNNVNSFDCAGLWSDIYVAVNFTSPECSNTTIECDGCESVLVLERLKCSYEKQIIELGCSTSGSCEECEECDECDSFECDDCELSDFSDKVIESYASHPYMVSLVDQDECVIPIETNCDSVCDERIDFVKEQNAYNLELEKIKQGCELCLSKSELCIGMVTEEQCGLEKSLLVTSSQPSVTYQGYSSDSQFFEKYGFFLVIFLVLLVAGFILYKQKNTINESQGPPPNMQPPPVPSYNIKKNDETCAESSSPNILHR